MNLDSGLIGILYKLFRPVELLITYILSFWHKIFVFLGMPDGPEQPGFCRLFSL